MEAVKNTSKLKTLKRALKRAFGHKWYRRNNKEEKAVLKDLKWMPEEVIDYLLLVELTWVGQFIQDINTWIEMEELVTGDKYRRYKAGWGKEVFQNINKTKEKQK